MVPGTRQRLAAPRRESAQGRLPVGPRRQPVRRTARSVLGLALLAGLLGVGPAAPASAGCAGPQLTVGERAEVEAAPAPPVLALGSAVTVSGLWFHTGCDDTGQGAGCGAPPSTQAPMRDVALVLEQDGAPAVLGTADAAGQQDEYRIRWQVRVPTGLRPGPATLAAGGTSVPVELRAG